MGMVAVAALQAFAAAVPSATMTATFARTSSRGVALFDDDVLAFDIARRAQALAERLELLLVRGGLPQKPDAGELLLRARRTRPESGGGEECDQVTTVYPVHSRARGNPGARVVRAGSPRSRGRTEFRVAPPHSITSSAVASSLSGTVRPSILAVETLMTNSNLVDCTTGRSAGLAPLRMRPV